MIILKKKSQKRKKIKKWVSANLQCIAGGNPAMDYPAHPDGVEMT